MQGQLGDPNSVEAQLLDMMLRAGSRWVLWLLIGLSFAAVAVALERIVFFVLERHREDAVGKALDAVKSGNLSAAKEALLGARSMQAAVARTCLEHAGEGPAAVEEYAAGTMDTERLRYERGLAFLGTLGNNAPFIGLFGTVLGIIRAFHDLSLNTNEGSAAVMAGIAEALVATGVGLLVALPAVAAYNGFARHVEGTITGAEAITHTILGRIKGTGPLALDGPSDGPSASTGETASAEGAS